MLSGEKDIRGRAGYVLSISGTSYHRFVTKNFYPDLVLLLFVLMNGIVDLLQTPAPRVRVMRNAEDIDNNTVGEKLCKHKYSSYPYCYGDITKEENIAGKCGVQVISSVFLFHFVTSVLIGNEIYIQVGILCSLVDNNLHRNGGPSSLPLNNAQEDLTPTPALTSDREVVISPVFVFCI